MKKIIGILAALLIVFTLSINVDALLTNTSINSIDLAALTTANAFEEEEEQDNNNNDDYYEYPDESVDPRDESAIRDGYLCTWTEYFTVVTCMGIGSEDCVDDEFYDGYSDEDCVPL